MCAAPSGRSARVTASGGTQSAPRQKMGTPLSESVNAPSARSTSTVRNPAVPRSRSMPSTVRPTGYSGWSPWVWGHHRSAAGTRMVASRTVEPSTSTTVVAWRWSPTRSSASVPASTPSSRRRISTTPSAPSHVARTLRSATNGSVPTRRRSNGAPGPHGRPARRPPLDAAEQRRAVPALVLGAEEQASPSGTGPAPGEQRGQGGEAEQEHVVRLEPVDTELVRNPHVLRMEQVLVVEPDVGDGGQPVEVELPRAFEQTFRRVEPAPVPPVAPVQKTLVVVPPRPPPEVPQRARRGPGNRRRRPRPVVSGCFGRVDRVLGFVRPAFPYRSVQDVARSRIRRCWSHGAISAHGTEGPGVIRLKLLGSSADTQGRRHSV